MRRFRFDADVGHVIERFGSVNAKISPIMRPEKEAQIGCLHIGAGGLIGGHPAVGQQLFLVVSGEGWVRTQSQERQPITAGHAAFWEDGEWHESGSETGMMVIVIEGEQLDPAQFMAAE